MSLLSKAKVITTPTAYSDGILHSVKPNVVLGDELVVNGSFDTDSNWTKTNAVIADGKATVTVVGGSYSVVRQALFSYVSGRSYVLEAEVQGTSGKACTFFDNGSNNGGLTTSNGIINFDGSVQRVYIEWTANANSDAILCARNGTGDFEFTIDNISVKEKIDADFTFTRNSSATRVGEDGYIQDVQIIGSELVQNGDFEEIGSEEIVNGGFDGSSNWGMQSSWSISNGSANYDGISSHYIEQSNVFSANTNYKITFTISNNTSGIISIRDGVSSTLVPNTNYANGTHTFYIKSNTNTSLRIYGVGGSGSLSIDNVSVKEVGQNWNFGTGWTMGDGVATCDGTNGAILRQTNAVPLNTKLRATLEVKNYVSGSLQIKFAPIGYNLTITGNGTYTIETNADNSTNGDIQIISTPFVGEIDNVSVKEVTDDTNLPRINYEGGKGHLLLEGQSTNLITHSEEINSNGFAKINSSIDSNVTISPDGSVNADLLKENTAFDSHFAYKDFNLTNGVTYTISIFAKSNGENRNLRLGDGSVGWSNDFDSDFNLTLGTATNNGVIEDYGNGWYRCSVVGTTNATTSRLIIYSTLNTSTSYQGDGVSGVYLFGFQIEQGNISSYIPTNGSAVTRAAETCNNAGNADLFDSEGVLYADIKPDVDYSTYSLISISDGTTANNVVLGKSINTGKYYTTVKSGASNQFSYDFAVEDVFNKIAVRYKENDFSVWLNGVQVHTDTSGIEPVGLNQLAFDFGGGTLRFYGKTKMVAVFPYLSNDEMECLTGEGYGSFEAMALANNYTII